MISTFAYGGNIIEAKESSGGTSSGGTIGPTVKQFIG